MKVKETVSETSQSIARMLHDNAAVPSVQWRDNCRDHLEGLCHFAVAVSESKVLFGDLQNK